MMKKIITDVLADIPISIISKWRRKQLSFSHPGSISDLDLPVGDTPYIITSKRSILSVVEIRGVSKQLSEETYNDLVEGIEGTFKTLFRDGNAAIAWCYLQEDDEETNRKNLEKILGPTISCSRLQGLDNEETIQQSIDQLAKAIQSEKVYLCVWSRSEKIPPSMYKNVVRFRTNTDAETPDIQKLNDYESSAHKHIETIERVRYGLSEAGIINRIITNQEMISELAVNLDPEGNDGFVPRLFSQLEGKHPNGHDTYEKTQLTREPQNHRRAIKGTDYRVVLPPKIGYQLFRSPVEYVSSRYVKIGRRLYGSVVVTLAPDEPVSFNAIVEYAKSRNLPFRMSQVSNIARRGPIAARQAMMGLLAAIKSPNASTLSGVYGKLKKRAVQNQTNISLQITFTTWSKTGDQDELNARMETLLQLVNRWGNSQGQIVVDDALYGVLSSLPPYRCGSIAEAATGPINEILYLAPLTRPTSILEKGGIIFHDDCGKPIVWQPMNPAQSHHVYLISGMPGYGKSMLFQIILLALVESSEELPYIVGSDIGPSQRGTIHYLTSILPKSRKRLVQYYDIQNSSAYAVNPCDTLLRCRFPHSSQKLYIQQYYRIVITDTAETDKPFPKGCASLLDDAIALAFERCGDTGPRAQPKTYDPVIQSDKYWPSIVEPALARIEFNYTAGYPTYWSMVDALYEHGEYHAAQLTQRFAVPLAEDIADAVISSELASKAKRTIDGSNYTLGEYLFERINDARKEFAILKSPTQVDLSQARVISFDYNSVMPSTDDAASARLGAIYFGAYSSAAMNKFFYSPEIIRELPENCREYHAREMARVRRTKNIFACDELQRFIKCVAALSLAERIASEGRKTETGTLLATQRPQEFSSKLKELSTARFFMGFNDAALKGAEEAFTLSETEVAILRSLRQPNKNGATFLTQMEINGTSISLKTTLKLATARLWSLSTKNRSDIIRTAITSEFGYTRGLQILSKLFPSGEVETECERRINLLSGSTNSTLSGLPSNDQSKQSQISVTEAIKAETIKKGQMYFQELLQSK